MELSYLDSNQDKQNQNRLCYHYTIGQSSLCFLLKSGAKIVYVCEKSKYCALFFISGVNLVKNWWLIVYGW